MIEKQRAGQSQLHRVRAFVDFWNFTLAMKEADKPYRTDWSKLGPALCESAAGLVDSGAKGDYQGLNFYGSYDPRSEPGRKSFEWATDIVDTFRGVSVSMSKRNRKHSPPKCPACFSEIPVCTECGADMRGTEEKGVDVRMATDMIKLAWEDNYDIAVLVSSDRDFVPVAEFLETKGIKVIHGAFTPKGRELTKACWGNIDLFDMRETFRLVK